jgi:hypothetical protein
MLGIDRSHRRRKQVPFQKKVEVGNLYSLETREKTGDK